MNSYDLGSQVRIFVLFESGLTVDTRVPADPSAITIRTKSPSGVVTDYIYNQPGSPVRRSSTGLYYMDFTPAESGKWYYKGVGTGTVIATDETSLFVKASAF